jgi:hypothetical protein
MKLASTDEFVDTLLDQFDYVRVVKMARETMGQERRLDHVKVAKVVQAPHRDGFPARERVTEIGGQSRTLMPHGKCP